MASDPLPVQELRLKALYDNLDGSISADQRRQINDDVKETWRSILSLPESFFYPFDSLAFVGKIPSPDNLLRIYTWNLVDERGAPLYFCFIQVRDQNEGTVTFYELTHNRTNVVNFESSVITADEWYGILYYEIIPVQTRKGVFYTLLGFDLNTILTNKKIIDVMYWGNGELKFGAPLFLIGRNLQHRVIFEYSSRSMMSLRFNKKMNMIVYDHLSPSNPIYTGQFQFYGPDFSFDGFVFENERWKQMTDLDILNQ